jgi:hypothetical protein
MLIRRLPGAPRATSQYDRAELVFEVQLSATPSLQWRVAFHRPPPQLVDSGDLRQTSVTWKFTEPLSGSGRPGPGRCVSLPHRRLDRLCELGYDRRMIG